MANTIQIRKVNESFIHIDTDNETILDGLNKTFAIAMENMRYVNPTSKWDGKTRLFNKTKHTLPLGLLPTAKRFLVEVFDKEVDVEFNDTQDRATVTKEFLEWCSNNPVYIGGEQVVPYLDQLNATIDALVNPKGITLSPTSSGKTLIIYLQTMFLHQKYPDMKILILFPTTTLIEQTYGDFQDYSLGSCPPVQKIYGYKGSTNTIEENIILSTWQSIYKEPPLYFEQFGTVLVDECHGGEAKNVKRILERSHNAVYKRGYTGTLKDTKLHTVVLQGIFGTVYVSITFEEMVKQGRISKCDIKVLQLHYTEQECKDMHKMNFQEEMIYVGTCEKRNQFIVDYAKKLEGNTLILFQRIEKHGHHIRDMFHGTKGIPKKKVFYIDGKTATERRNNVREMVEGIDGGYIIASYQTFSTGINIKNLQNIIFASSYKSKIKVLQSIGRGLRKDGKKNEITVYDMVDDFTFKGKSNYTLKQFVKRFEIYCKNNFKVQVDEHDLL